MRIEIHVRPGASRAGVGGSHDGALVVRVAEPADAGRATAAALRAVAEALGVPGRAVTLLRGAASRRKLIEVDEGAADGRAELQDRLARLLAPPPDGI
ncbi:MAG TPA: DUF167 domain-containing protein [Acidimicrobiales bacterium]|nr:DUF167 domain-containing protein [Acidimicrobiales bacterium]